MYKFFIVYFIKYIILYYITVFNILRLQQKCYAVKLYTSVLHFYILDIIYNIFYYFFFIIKSIAMRSINIVKEKRKSKGTLKQEAL